MFTKKDIIYTPPFHINYNLTVGNKLKRFMKEDIDFDVFLPSIGKNLQRGYVWSSLQKEQLIWTVIKNKKIGILSLIEHAISEKEKKYEVIDGKQRLSTLFSYLKNEFPIFYKEKPFFYKDLDNDIRISIERLSLNANIGYSYWDEPITDEDKILWFEELNFLGTPQDQKHLMSLKTKGKV